MGSNWKKIFSRREILFLLNCENNLPAFEGPADNRNSWKSIWYSRSQLVGT